MKAVLISIKPKWCELIASGKKTVEVRKTKPKLETPFKCYIYCTKGNSFAEKTLRGFDDKGKAIYYKANKGKVIGEFMCDWIVDSPIWRLRGNTGFLAPRTEKEACLPHNACLTLDELKAYVGSENKCVCGWHISDLVIYDKPRKLGEFQSPCNHENDCCTCKRAIYCSSNHQFHHCELEDGLKRPPQSWCYVERSKNGK